MTKQVLQELKEISHYCHQHFDGRCEKCLFCMQYGCFFGSWPDEWHTKELEEKVKERVKHAKEKTI